jgi:dihydrofolate reductase
LACRSLEEALERAFEQALIDGADAAMIVGGAEIYRLALPRANKVVLTRVQGPVEGDVAFDLDLLADWREKLVKKYSAGGGNSHAFSIVELEPPQIEQ